MLAHPRHRICLPDMNPSIAPDKSTNLIFLVEDDGVVRDSMRFALEAHGYGVRAFARPSELLGERFPARGCLVVPCESGDASGTDLLSELRRRRIDLPAVLLTSALSVDVCRRAIEFASPIIEKPLTTPALLCWIRALLDSHRDRATFGAH